MSQPTEELPWVYDPETKHVYQGPAFEGLKVLERDDAGELIIPSDAEANPALDSLTVDELKTRAEQVGADLAGASKKADIVAAITKAEEAAK